MEKEKHGSTDTRHAGSTSEKSIFSPTDYSRVQATDPDPSNKSHAESTQLLEENSPREAPDVPIILNKLGSRAVDPRRPLSVILRHKVKKGQEPAYEKLMSEAAAYAHANAPGHLGTDQIKPLHKDGEYVVIFKFDSYEHLVPWIKSPARAKFLTQIQELVAHSTATVECSGLVIVEHGSEVATPPAPPPKWKHTFVLWLGAYVLASILGMTLTPYMVKHHLPLPLIVFIIDVILIILLSYLVVPLMGKCFRPFLTGRVLGCGRNSRGWFCGTLNHGLPCLQPNTIRVAPLQARIVELEDHLLRLTQQNKTIFTRLLELEIFTGKQHPAAEARGDVEQPEVEQRAAAEAERTLQAAREALQQQQQLNQSADQTEATVILKHTVKQEFFHEYEQWCSDIYCVASQASTGFKGSTLVRPPPGSHVYTLVFKYDTVNHLETWLANPIRRHWLARVQPYLDGSEVHVHAGFFAVLENLFNSTDKEQNQLQPRKWKTCILTIIALYLVLLPVNIFLVPVLKRELKNVWLINLISTPVAVGITSFVAAPIVGLMAEVWLHSPWTKSPWLLIQILDSGFPGL